jgi:hypothetical protein
MLYQGCFQGEMVEANRGYRDEEEETEVYFIATY